MKTHHLITPVRTFLKSAIVAIALAGLIIPPGITLAGDGSTTNQSGKECYDERCPPNGFGICGDPSKYTICSREEAEAALLRIAQYLDLIEKEVTEWGYASAAGLILADPGMSGTNRGFTHAGFDDNYTKVKNNLGVQGSVAITKATSLGLAVGNEELADDIRASESERVQAFNKAAVATYENTTRTAEINRQILEAQGNKVLKATLDPSLFPETEETEGDNSSLIAKPVYLGAPEAASLENLPGKSNDVELLTLPGTTQPDVDGKGSGIFDILNNENGTVQILDRKIQQANPDPASELERSALGNSISAADRIKLAISAVVGGKVADYLSDPYALTENKVVYIAMGQVSVVPGWRTKQNYACELTLMPEYATYENGELIQSGIAGETPILSAAFPMAEAQILDLQFTQYQQLQLMLDIANRVQFTGNQSSFRALLRFTKEYQREVATRNAIPTVVPISDANTVTYRFIPALQAVDRPFQKNAKPGQVLNSISIPVMIAVVCDASDLEDWDYLNVNTSVRWVPIEKQTVLSKVGSIAIKNRVNDRLKTNVSTMTSVQRMEEIACWLGALEVAGYKSLYRWEEAYRRYRAIETKGFAESTTSQLPIEQPTIIDVSPSSVPIIKGSMTENVEISIFGKNFLPRFQKTTYGYSNEDAVEAFLGGVRLTPVQQTHMFDFNSFKHNLVFELPATKFAQLSGSTNAVLRVNGPGGYAEKQLTLDPIAAPKMVVTSAGVTPGKTKRQIVIRGENFPECNLFQVLVGNVIMEGANVKRLSNRILIASSDSLEQLDSGSYDIDVIAGESAAHKAGGVVIKKEEKPTAKVKVNTIEPETGYLDESTYFAIEGENFVNDDGAPQISTVMIGTQKAEEILISRTRILLKVSKTQAAALKDKGQQAIAFLLNGSVIFTGNKKLEFNIPKAADAMDEHKNKQKELKAEFERLSRSGSEKNTVKLIATM